MSCCPRPTGPIRPDEDPSPEDVEQFGKETTPCPDCGAEIYDEAEWCHKCGRVLGEAKDTKGLPTWAAWTALGVVAIMVTLALSGVLW
ncbi:MAG: hypothetical protein AABZ53_17930 [Planctomycetota bacterium]